MSFPEKSKQTFRSVQFSDGFAQLHAEYGRWIPYTMPAVDAVRVALQDGTIQPVDVPQVLRGWYVTILVLV